MSTTTIRLPKALKARVEAAADRAGTTAHGLILEAVAEKAANEEPRAALYDLADRRYAQFAESGKSILWPDTKSYLQARIKGRKFPRPGAQIGIST